MKMKSITHENVYDTTESIQKLFPKYKVACLHGRMTTDEKQEIMQEFHDNDIPDY